MQERVVTSLFGNAKNSAATADMQLADGRATELRHAIQIATGSFNQADRPTPVFSCSVSGEMMQHLESSPVRLHLEDGAFPFLSAVFECAVKKTILALEKRSRLAPKFIEGSDELVARVRNRRRFVTPAECRTGERK